MNIDIDTNDETGNYTFFTMLRSGNITSRELSRFYKMDYQAMCYALMGVLNEIDVDVDSRTSMDEHGMIIKITPQEALTFAAGYDDQLRFIMAECLLQTMPATTAATTTTTASGDTLQ